MFLPSRATERFKGQYPKFVTAIMKKRNELSELGTYWELSTDITLFYPSIDHELIITELNNRNLLNDERLEKLLLNCLEKWSNAKLPRGLPIGYETSDLLGTILLLFLDQKYEEYGLIRYVDDMYLFASSESEAIKLLNQISLELQQYGLYINNAKTKIRSIPQAIEDDNFRVSLPPLREANIQHESITEDDFFQVYTSESSDDIELIRNKAADLAYLFYRLKTKNSLIRDIALVTLREAPRWSFNMTTYLSLFTQDGIVVNGLFDAAKDGSLLSVVRIDCIRTLVKLIGVTEEIIQIVTEWITQSLDWQLKYEGLDIVQQDISSDFAFNIANNDTDNYVRSKAISICFAQSTETEQKIAVLNLALADKSLMIQSLGIYLWRRDVGISRLNLKLNKMKREFKDLYLSVEEKQQERYFFSTMYYLFDYKLNEDLPIHTIDGYPIK
jgi:hypothetical protein